MALKKRNIFLSSFILGVSSCTYASTCDINLGLEQFHENPHAFMRKPVDQFNDDCKLVPRKKVSLDEMKNYITLREAERKSKCREDLQTGASICLKDIPVGKDIPAGRAGITSIDRVENLFEGQSVVKNLLKLQEMDLSYGKVESQPWSDWYWPISVGQLSYRYNDPNMSYEFRSSSYGGDYEKMWQFVKEYAEKNPASQMSSIETLSPSEKYDLLVGDYNFTLTKYMHNVGKQFADENGKVASWMGICHGWAPASYMLPRPTKPVTLKGANGDEITFLPADIKALGSQLWASGTSNTKFIGGRCNTVNPELDPKNGRIIDDACFNNNPGTWHLAVLNHIGINKKPFVIDATFDSEVWNHPVLSYSYKYFNPLTMRTVYTDDLETAMVKISEFTNDKFADYRDDKTVAVIGVQMEVSILVETNPTNSTSDSSYRDGVRHLSYAYDLELDGEMNIIGGEWYNNKHPDFIWSPYENTKASSIVDMYFPLGVNLEGMLFYQNLKVLSPMASSRGQVIGPIVRELFKKASN